MFVMLRNFVVNIKGSFVITLTSDKLCSLMCKFIIYYKIDIKWGWGTGHCFLWVLILSGGYRSREAQNVIFEISHNFMGCDVL